MKKGVQNLSEEAKEARRKYHREWQKKNPDKIKKNNAAYWEKKAREMREQAKKEE